MSWLKSTTKAVNSSANNEDGGSEEFQKRLHSIGITSAQAKELGLRELDNFETAKAVGFCRGQGSIEIPYFDVSGERTGFCRYRFMSYRGKGKYVQNRPGCSVYFQPGYEWPRILSNVAEPLLITEGEFKAIAANAVAAAYESTCIALGGVYSFSTAANRIAGDALIPELSGIHLRGREVFLCFDYDGTGSGEPKPEVRRAELILASLLTAKGAVVYFCRLADMRRPMEKVGLDDYLEAGGQLSELLKQARGRVGLGREEDACAPLYQMLGKWYEYRGQAVDVNTGVLLGFEKLSNSVANQFVGDKPAFQLWKQSKYRGSIVKIDFLPECDDALVTGPDGLILNTWRGWSPLAIKDANIAPWLEFKSKLFSREPHMERELDLWIAGIIQRPWVKQFRLPIVKSHAQGVGKSFFFESVAFAMVGGVQGLFRSFSPAKILGPTDLEDQWTDWVEGCVFALFNEPGELGSRHSNTIKDLITGESLRVNAKYGLKYTIRNRVNCAITTNMDYTHRFSAESRREMVFEPPIEIMLAMDWPALVKWRDHEGGLGAIMAYYTGYAIGDYTGREPAPMSEAKKWMSSSGLVGWDAYIDAELNGAIFISLKREYERARAMDIKGSKQSFGAALRKAGWELKNSVAGKGQIDLRKYGCGQEIVWGHAGSWDGATNEGIAAHLRERYFGGGRERVAKL